MSVNAPDFDVVATDLYEGKHRLIVDMDAHLDAVELDFRNVYVKWMYILLHLVME